MIAYHRQEDMRGILKSVKKGNKPRSFCGHQNISLHQDVFDLIHLCECRFLHFLQRDHFLRILLASEVDFAISSLSNLGNDVEILQA